MRLWHIDLIKNGLLPKSQLISQWRELNSIFKKQDKHILINYIYDYNERYLGAYSLCVISELLDRNINVNFDNYANYFASDMYPSCYVKEDIFYQLETLTLYPENILKFNEHNDQYLLICFMNLYEKYIRGQKDFTKECFDKLYDFVNTKFDLKSLGIEK